MPPMSNRVKVIHISSETDFFTSRETEFSYTKKLSPFFENEGLLTDRLINHLHSNSI